jgi:hypothetical protein
MDKPKHITPDAEAMYRRMWTDDRAEWLVLTDQDGTHELAFHVPSHSALLIEDAVISKWVVEEMQKAGIRSVTVSQLPPEPDRRRPDRILDLRSSRKRK